MYHRQYYIYPSDRSTCHGYRGQIKADAAVPSNRVLSDTLYDTTARSKVSEPKRWIGHSTCTFGKPGSHYLNKESDAIILNQE